MEYDKWVKLAQKGDQDAFVLLIKNNENSMYRVARSFFKDDIDCADVIQETILKAFQSLKNLKEPKYFKTWLIRILINECKKMIISKKKVVNEVVEETKVDSYHSIEIQEAIDSLDVDIRTITVLFYLEDRPVKEIAKLLEIPEGTVKSRLNRARSKLANLLQSENERSVRDGK
ncbi:sigma-70 family RNA polymerase sigma factor [Chengkuizengella axinellae]|uniref:Sigma-70 family RNA polymerase sigma factor n=1 Tax=Chengkuizengella axinellae TaxID=3064388 RepID=A0ABT9J4J7_9BACL|nr:sigma-70 family RNA polymerase sigma factor [Chengkuizengella sp. 2205SS18-9]MDP5276403.1 sigma-70 family RNA polymerase sigma factor [Chengkuizengella sp. 2205SS18-9]